MDLVGRMRIGKDMDAVISMLRKLDIVRGVLPERSLQSVLEKLFKKVDHGDSGMKNDHGDAGGSGDNIHQ